MIVRFIIIVSFLYAGVIFDAFSPIHCYVPADTAGPDCTNWSIFWFCVTYGGYLGFSIDGLSKARLKVDIYYMILAIIVLGSCIIRELSLINAPYDEYAQVINSRTAKFVGNLFVTISSISITIDVIVRTKKKVNKSLNKN